MSRFIVGNNHLSQLGGSETFTYAFVEELVRLGHEVDVICPTGSQGVASDALYENFGIVVDGSIPPEGYDAAFLSHNTTARMFFYHWPNFDPAKVIQTIHGAFSPLEQPYHDTHRQIQYVTISDELREKYPYARTIMNGVNLERFKPGEKVPGSVLSMCQSEPFNQMLSEICSELGLSFKSRNKFTNPIWEIETELSTAEIAIGIGRSAIEAMACGCAVLVADHRPYQGAMTDGYGMFMHSNYSGRGYRFPANYENMTAYISGHRRMAIEIPDKVVEWSRAHAEQHHDIRKQVQRYLEMVNA